jgi:hypothetical protein
MDMNKVTIINGFNSFEIVSINIIDLKDDRREYHKHRDIKYKTFLKKHNFKDNERVYDLYLRLCGADLI